MVTDKIFDFVKLISSTVIQILYNKYEFYNCQWYIIKWFILYIKTLTHLQANHLFCAVTYFSILLLMDRFSRQTWILWTELLGNYLKIVSKMNKKISFFRLTHFINSYHSPRSFKWCDKFQDYGDSIFPLLKIQYWFFKYQKISIIICF